MDYNVKLNLKRVRLNNDKVFNDFVDFLKENMTKVGTTYYEMMQAKILALSFIEATEEIGSDRFAILRDIALCYYRINF